MSVKSDALLKVKTLSRSTAKQIVFLPINWKEGTTFRRVCDALESGSIEPVGWVNSTALDNGYPDGYWLISFEGRYYWFPANIRGLNAKYPNVEQLFI